MEEVFVAMEIRNEDDALGVMLQTGLSFPTKNTICLSKRNFKKSKLPEHGILYLTLSLACSVSGGNSFLQEGEHAENILFIADRGVILRKILKAADHTSRAADAADDARCTASDLVPR